MTAANPILVEVTRGGDVESAHRGAACVVDHQGRMLHAWGDVERAILPRSAVKPLQAVALLATGAARAFSVSAAEIALACASHGGESVHTEAVARWLGRLGYDPGILECGAHAPSDKPTRTRLTRAGQAPCALHNNCSGKHAGFLTVCRHLGISPAGYIQVDHPVQALVREALARLTEVPLDDAAHGIDGCGIPVYGIPLQGLALAMAKLAAPPRLDQVTAAALTTIRDSMIAHPYQVAGRERFCTELMQALAPNVAAKGGAEGVHCAAVADRGLGIALKIDDGATRASEVALGGILHTLDLLDDSTFAALRSKLEPELLNVAGRQVGSIRPSAAIASGL